MIQVSILKHWLFAVFTALILGAIGNDSALAQLPYDKGQNPRMAAAISGLLDLEDSTALELAKSGTPYWVTIKAEQLTAREVLNRFCGQQKPLTKAYLEERFIEINYLSTFDQHLEKDQTVEIPYCLKVIPSISYTVAKGDTVSEILKQHYGLWDIETQETFVRMNESQLVKDSNELKTLTTEQLTRRLTHDTQVQIPYAESRLYIPLDAKNLRYLSSPNDLNFVISKSNAQKLSNRWRAAAIIDQPTPMDATGICQNLSETLKAISNRPPGSRKPLQIWSAQNQPIATFSCNTTSLRFAPKITPLQPQAIIEDQLVSVPKPERFESGGITPQSTSTSEPHCSASNNYQPFDVTKFVDRLTRETEKFQSAADDMPKKVTVGIIDTGLGRRNKLFDEFFPERVWSKDRIEALGEEGEDDNNSGIDDDIYGISSSKSGDVHVLDIFRSNPRFYNASQHGTKVASLLIGGPQFRKQKPSSTPELVGLKVVNYSQANMPPRPGSPLQGSPDKLDHYFRYLSNLKNPRVSVVNISLRVRGRLTGIKQVIKNEDSNILFVVAAGQEVGKPGGDLISNPSYPAGFGGSGLDNVVTVAASNQIGDITTFSNYSSEKVDLLAPGCAVPVLDSTGEVSWDSGTSVATPQVSFAAAVIKALSLFKPAELKNRLIISADYDPKLSKFARSSSRLNLIKAISVRTDVIERNSDHKLEFGTIKNLSSLGSYCVEDDIRHIIQANNVKIDKVVFDWSKADQPQMSVWLRNNAEDLSEKRSCNMKTSVDDIAAKELEFSVVWEDSNKTSPVRAGDIANIVFAKAGR